MDLICAHEPPPGAIATLSPGEQFVVISDSPTTTGEESSALQALGDGCFVPLPELLPNKACHLHMCGPSGCGKSTFCNMYAGEFKKHLGGQVYVISADGSPDPNLTNVDVRVPIDETLANVKLETLAGEPGSPPALIIFDDVEGLDKDKATALRVFEQAVKERGRKMGLHSISVYHRGAANKATQASLGEATAFVVFPQNLSTNTTYMLKKYADIPDEVAGLIRRGGWGRWLCISPGNYLLGEKKAAIIDPAFMTAIAKAEKKRMNSAAAKALAKADDEAAADAGSALDKLSGLGYR